MAGRSSIRIAVNVALDGGLAALAVPAARWIADPAGPVLEPIWLLPAGVAALLLAGLPFRLSLQYWRFAGIGDLLGLAATSALAAGLFGLATGLAGVSLGNPAFPVVHALTLFVLLGAPRVAYRWLRARPRAAPEVAPQAGSVLLVGALEDADLFLRALAQDRRQALDVIGLLALGSRQTGRRIQGRPILGRRRAGRCDPGATVRRRPVAANAGGGHAGFRRAGAGAAGGAGGAIMG